MAAMMCTPQKALDERQLSDLFVQAGTPEALAIARNPTYVKAILKQLKYVNDVLAAGNGPAMAAALVSAADNAFSAGVKTQKKSAAGSAAAFGVSQFATSIGLLKLASNASPGKAVATVGLAFAQKVVLASGLVAESDRAKCYNAIASVVVSTGVTVVSAPSGVGLVLGGMAIVASAFEAHQACR